MGIHKLMDLIREKAPNALRTRDITYYSGMWIALDASMAMYQFIISVQGHDNTFLSQLTDKDGNKTGHLLGLFNRTLGLLEAGVKPVWVFDGQPPKNKNGQILRRKKMKEQAAQKADLAEEQGQLAQALKQQQRNTRITKQEKEDAIKMLTLMGIPVIMAPGEAEAQCSLMCKQGIVNAVGTQDMDALTFGASILLRQLNHRKEPITQINRQAVLQGFEMNEQEFRDLCILCGCDYAARIGGIGPVKAFKMIKDHSNLQNVLKFLKDENAQCGQQNKKYTIPNETDFPYEDARQLFKNPKVKQVQKLVFDSKNMQQEQLRNFLILQKAFSEDRVAKAIQKIKSSGKKGVQPRLEAFFGKPTVIKSTPLMSTDKKGKKKGGKK